MTKRIASAAAYIAAAPAEKRATLAQLRKTIRAAAPQATEELRYGMLGYMQGGKPVIHLAYWKDHYALYGSFAMTEELKRYDHSGKGTVRFPANEPLPYRLIAKMVKTSVARLPARIPPPGLVAKERRGSR